MRRDLPSELQALSNLDGCTPEHQGLGKSLEHVVERLVNVLTGQSPQLHVAIEIGRRSIVHGRHGPRGVTHVPHEESMKNVQERFVNPAFVVHGRFQNRSTMVEHVVQQPHTSPVANEERVRVTRNTSIFIRREREYRREMPRRARSGRRLRRRC